MIQTRFINIVRMLLLMCIMFKSCKVYYEHSVSVEQAVSTEKKVKLILNNNETYTFYKLIKSENQLFGITKINSVTAKKLDTLIVRCNVNGEIAKIKLFKKNIKEIYLQK